MNNQKDTIRREIEEWFDKHSDEMISDLGRVLAVKSVRDLPAEGAPYGKASREALDLAAGIIKERGFEVSLFEDMILTADIGPNPPKMGILAHLDVVDAGDGWDTDPFGMTVKDGRIYGRGALDNKGPSIAAIYAMNCAGDLCPELQHGFRLLLGTGEETGCLDIARYLEVNKPPPHVFTPDASYPMVNVEKGRTSAFFSASWEKEQALPKVISINGGKTMNVVPDRAEAVIEGFSMKDLEMFCMVSSAQTGTKICVNAGEEGIVVTVEGKATHAATPELGVNAQTALLDMLSGMPFADSKGFRYICSLHRLFPHGDYKGRAIGIAMEDKISGELTLNFGVLMYSETEFSANFDSRTPACADETDLIGMIRTAFQREDITLTNQVISTCHHTPEESEFVQMLLRIYGDYTGNPTYCTIMGGQTYVHEIQGGVAFGSKMPDLENNVHGVNEFIEVDQLIVSAKMFAQAIIEMCG